MPSLLDPHVVSGAPAYFAGPGLQYSATDASQGRPFTVVANASAMPPVAGPYATTFLIVMSAEKRTKTARYEARGQVARHGDGWNFAETWFHVEPPSANTTFRRWRGVVNATYDGLVSLAGDASVADMLAEATSGASRDGTSAVASWSLAMGPSSRSSYAIRLRRIDAIEWAVRW